MPLKTFVKVGSITNLSDARYCAGMMVDMLGFRSVEGQEGYIKPAQFQEIRGWISGPLVISFVAALADSSGPFFFPLRSVFHHGRNAIR